ncbi:hypothetical protein ACIRNI_15285 [Streptomyces sp. NPDC093546]|uniref:hypothetical protein n=1 Tax=Streptomyces sp. NPDC093546 TaxID=3366040 RepID=UPI00382D04ED
MPSERQTSGRHPDVLELSLDRGLLAGVDTPTDAVEAFSESFRKSRDDEPEPVEERQRERPERRPPRRRED